MYQKVLVPLDGSILAECALSHVKNLASHGALEEVTLLNVTLMNLDWDEIEEGFDYTIFRESLRKQSRRYLADVQSRLAAEGIAAKPESLDSDSAAHAITDYARKNAMDMIIMSTHGRTGKRNLMFGSVALSVLHNSPIPVLMIRPEACLQ